MMSTRYYPTIWLIQMMLRPYSTAYARWSSILSTPQR
jgi:hypothetical protein